MTSEPVSSSPKPWQWVLGGILLILSVLTIIAFQVGWVDKWMAALDDSDPPPVSAAPEPAPAPAPPAPIAPDEPEVTFQSLSEPIPTAEDDPAVTPDRRARLASSRMCPLFENADGQVGRQVSTISPGRWFDIIRRQQQLSLLPTFRLEGYWVLIMFEETAYWIEEPCLKINE